MLTPSIFSAIKKVSSMLTREEKLKWLGIVFFSLTTSFFEVVTACVIVFFAQTLTQPERGQEYLALVGMPGHLSPSRVVFYTAVILGMVYLIKNLFATAEVFYQSFSIQKMSYLFKNKLLQRYAKADYGFYLTRSSSLGMQVVEGEAEQMFSNGLTSLASVFSECIVFACLMSTIFYMNLSLALAVLGVGVLLGIGVAKGLLPRFYQFGRNYQEASLHIQQNLIQFFHAFKEIVLLGKCDMFIQAHRRHSRKRAKIQAVRAAINALPRMAIESVFVALFVTTVAFFCLEHESPVQMVGILGGYFYVGFRLMPGLNRIINQLAAFKSTIPSIERVHHEYTCVVAKGNYRDVPNFQFKEGITLQDVHFRYLNAQKEALTEITLEIRKGENIGIVGETGSGKSTLVDLILGLLMPQKGCILIDHHFPVNAHQWHQRIGYVPQSIYLTDDTIASNIAFGEPDIDQCSLNSAIDAAQLRRFVEELPLGSLTPVGERGVRLSGGERQRIAIARALYRRPEVLIFDEATSALDNETEARLMETIQRICQSRTIIMIAHRLTTLKDCDRILVMERGRVKEVTQYENLQKGKEKRRGESRQ